MSSADLQIREIRSHACIPFMFTDPINSSSALTLGLLTLCASPLLSPDPWPGLSPHPSRKGTRHVLSELPARGREETWEGDGQVYGIDGREGFTPVYFSPKSASL